MEDFTTLQHLFLKWLSHHQYRNLGQIRKACKDLLTSFEKDTKNYLYKIFYPLLRCGLIEFEGKEKFSASAPCILSYPKENISVGVNLPKSIKDELSSQEIDFTDEIGFTRISTNKSLNFAGIKTSKPDCVNILRNFPKISDIVAEYKRVPITSSGEVFDSMTRKWCSIDKQGIFRKDKEAHKFYLKTIEGNYNIPSMDYNPEGWSLAEAYAANLNNLRCFKYDRQKKELTVEYIKLPILIDRILRMFSLYTANGVNEEFNKKTFSDVPVKAIRELKRIFKMEISYVK